MTYESAHRPQIAKGQQYIQWTEQHQLVAQGMPPCAVRLWQYLLTKYPGGVPQEIELEEARHEISQGRSKVYSVQSLKDAIWESLVPQGMIEVTKIYTGTVLTVAVIPFKDCTTDAIEPEKIKKYTEKVIKDCLQQTLGGGTEIYTPIGKIDLLTPCQIIEVKPIKWWKSALGQLLAYAFFYPKHEKRLHLFRSQPKTLDLIKHICNEYSVIVTFQEVM